MHTQIYARMPKMALKHALTIFLPSLAIVGPLLVLGVSRYLMHREDLQREKRLARVLARPEVVSDEMEHRFGVMDPATEGTHTFVIENTGGGPLELSLGTPSCPTIRGEILRPVVPAGESGEVRVTWTTGAVQTEYRQGLFIETNAPRNYQIRLMVGGTVRVQVGAEPRSLSVPRIEPGEAASVSTLVYSQVCPEFAVSEATCSIVGATCVVTPAEPEALEAIQATSGYQVTITLPPDMPSGSVQGEVRIETETTLKEQPESLTLVLPLTGRVLRRVAVYGVGVEETGIVDLGIHPPGRMRQRRLVLKVRDQDPQLDLIRAEFRPDFLQATLVPAGTEGKEHFYHLDITIPADAPECVHRGIRLGEMKLFFDHPRIPELSLQLALAIVSRP